MGLVGEVGSMMTLDLGEDANKVANVLNNCFEYGIKNGVADITNSELVKARQAARAAVDLVIAQVENLVAEIGLKGQEALYDALGLNEQVLQQAKQIVAIARHASNIGMSIIMKGITMLNAYQSSQINLPMDAYVAALTLCASFADRFYGAIMEAYGVYINFLVLCIVNPDAALELLVEFILVNVRQIYDMLDEQVYMYTGYHIQEIIAMCSRGIKLYKEYKARKKAKKEQAKEEKIDDNTTKSANISGSGYGVSIETDPKEILERLYEWLKDQNDALFNGFIVYQMLDAVESIEDMCKTFTEVNPKTLLDGVESLDDFIALCEELGLGDDSTAIDLSLIPSLNFNVIQSSMNSLKEQFNEATDMQKIKSSAIGAAGIVGSTVNLEKTYEIKTDTQTKVITVSYYDNPTKPSISKKVYKTFSKAKNADDEQLFSSSDLKTIQDTINDTYNQNQTSGNGSVKINGYTINIVLNIDPKKLKKKEDDVYQHSNKDKDKEIEDEQDNAPEFNITIRDEVVVSEEEINKRQRRSTIKVLHTAYSILKSLVPSLRQFAKLLDNYHTNKEYVKSQQKSNLGLMFEAVMAVYGYAKKLFKKDVALYTVRTVKLYDYIQNNTKINTSDTTTEISHNDAKIINKWLEKNDSSALKVDTSKDIIQLFFDMESINAERLEIERLKELGLTDRLIGNTAINGNGTFNNLPKIIDNGDSFLIADSNLPLNMSQIVETMSHLKKY